MSISEIADVKGVVIGDVFCQKRMFAHGQWSVPAYCEKLKECNLNVILQTPMYMTSRYLPQWLGLISYLEDGDLVDAVLVQDIGLLATLAQKTPGVTLCWGQMGRNRGSQINAPFLRLIMQLGATAIQLDNPARGEAVASFGLDVWQVYGALAYQSIWRECYSCDQLERSPQQCDRLCKRPLTLVSDELVLSVNGHILGEQLIYSPEAKKQWPFAQQQVVYAKNYSALKEVIT